jgi:hypothetical protein
VSGALTPGERRLVTRARGRGRVALVIGLACFLLGGAYSLWAVERLRATPIAEEVRAPDRPVARLAALVEPRLAHLAAIDATTALERALLRDLRDQVDLSGRALLLTLRLLIGSVLVTVGLALVAGAVAQRPLLSLIARRLPGPPDA